MVLDLEQAALLQIASCLVGIAWISLCLGLVPIDFMRKGDAWRDTGFPRCPFEDYVRVIEPAV